jgi:hypothetical protein
LTESICFAVCAFGCTVCAEADDPESFSVLDRYIFPGLPRSDSAGGTPAVTLRVSRSPKSREEESREEAAFQLSVDGEEAASAPQPIGLVPDIIHAIDEAVVHRLSAWRAVHAGTVVWNGRVLLLPGATHSGKSSMVAELLRRGATYFSDEYALIDREGLIHPYPRPLLLRNGSPAQVPVLAAELNAAVGDGPAPLGWMVLLDYKAGESWTVMPMAQSLAVLALLKNTPHTLADSPQMVEQFERAVAGAKCYAGRRGEAAAAADELLRLIEQA